MKYILFSCAITYITAVSALSVDIKKELKLPAIAEPEDGATTVIQIDEDDSISETSAAGLRKRSTISEDSCTPEKRQIVTKSLDRCAD